MKLDFLTKTKKGLDLARTITITTIIAAFGFSAFVYYTNIESNKEKSKIIYVMDKYGNTYQAQATPVEQVRKWQIEAAAKQVYTLWNSFDKNSFKANTDAALELLGECGKKMLADYDSHNMAFELRDRNMEYRVEIIEAKVDMGTKKGYIKGIQTISQNGVGIKRNLDIEFRYFDITPSPKNVFGLKIEDYNVTNDLVIE